jgi:hypothetical protein
LIKVSVKSIRDTEIHSGRVESWPTRPATQCFFDSFRLKMLISRNKVNEYSLKEA